VPVTGRDGGTRPPKGPRPVPERSGAEPADLDVERPAAEHAERGGNGPGKWRADRVGAALRGENPTVLRELPGGFAVIGDVQFLPGYAVFLTRDPRAGRLSDLPRRERSEFLAGMDLLGEAVERVCSRLDPAFLRVNLEILGNKDPFLHAHVWPRYAWEPSGLAARPVWLHPRERWSAEESALGPRHDGLRAAIGAELDRLARED
jgi:diadenosine tetraphosphate (Ap4A) HIT family hydrolase